MANTISNKVFIGDNGSNTSDDTIAKILNNTELIEGTDSKDTLTGTKKDDLIFGREGKDVIKGANGDDVLVGGTGNDTLTGGYGIDSYVLALDKSIDTITDYSTKDRIIIDKEAFSATSKDQFTYNDDTGKLFFDAEVKGTSPVHIATLPTDLGNKFDVEEDIIFDRTGMVDYIGNIDDYVENIQQETDALVDDILAQFDL